jgi:hypothetical protein
MVKRRRWLILRSAQNSQLEHGIKKKGGGYQSKNKEYVYEKTRKQ